MTDLSFWKDLAIILAGVVALVTFFFGFLEYWRQNNQHRASRFVEMRRRFLENELFRDILNLLATDDPALRTISIQDRRNFGGFLEEVALMVNSKMISPTVALYMFGDYVLLTNRSENFWHGLNKDGLYWTVFREFATEMEREKDLPRKLKTVRF
ncbi:MAG TPA: hypothetical protein VK934_13585 [Fimbriimonas sp.]|nr:hypothetical protein [Fimbriimonas sp.]